MHVREVLAILNAAAAEGVDAYGLALRIADAVVEHDALLAEAGGAPLVAVAIRARLPKTLQRSRHRCAACGLAVLVTGETLIRGCGHEDAAVIADMVAEAKGNGGIVDP